MKLSRAQIIVWFVCYSALGNPTFGLSVALTHGAPQTGESTQLMFIETQHL